MIEINGEKNRINKIKKKKLKRVDSQLSRYWEAGIFKIFFEYY